MYPAASPGTLTPLQINLIRGGQMCLRSLAKSCRLKREWAGYLRCRHCMANLWESPWACIAYCVYSTLYTAAIYRNTPAARCKAGLVPHLAMWKV